MADRAGASSSILQPLVPGNEVKGCPAGVAYAVLAIMRMVSYFFCLAMYCTYEPAAGGWAGCEAKPPTLSTASSYLGVYGRIRSSLVIAICLVQATTIWMVLRFVYCELLQNPPLPNSFTVALSVSCLLDIIQVVTAHSTEHWVIAHIFFLSLCVALMFFFHGTLSSSGLWGHGATAVALPSAAVLFFAVVGLCTYMLASFQFDQSKTLETGVWVRVEYFLAVLVTAMQVGISLALPPGLTISHCFQAALASEPSGPKATPATPQQRTFFLGGCGMSTFAPCEKALPQQPLEHRLRGGPTPAGRAHLRASAASTEVPRLQRLGAYPRLAILMKQPLEEEQFQPTPSPLESIVAAFGKFAALLAGAAPDESEPPATTKTQQGDIGNVPDTPRKSPGPVWKLASEGWVANAKQQESEPLGASKFLLRPIGAHEP